MSIVQDTLTKLYEQGGIRSAHNRAPGASLARNPSPRETSRPEAYEPSEPAQVVRIERGTLRAAGLIPPEPQARELAEQFQHIKRPLIEHARGCTGTGNPLSHLILVTSALPGEGKTFTCLNLAISMAFEKDIRVLLVDADVAKPQITRLLGLESMPGFLDALRDSSLDIHSLILPTDLPGLSLLPTGQPAEHTTELLASARMQEIAHQIGGRNLPWIVLFDSPALLPRTEAATLAQALGQVLVVVRAGATPQQCVLDAVERIGGDKPVSAVLNQSFAMTREGSKLYGQGVSRDSHATV